MKNFALRIFNIFHANERQNQVPLRRTTIHAIFLLTVRRIRMFFSLKPSLSQGKNFSSLGLAVSEELGSNKQTDSLTDWCFDREIKIIWWGGAGSKGKEEANKVQSMIFTIF